VRFQVVERDLQTDVAVVIDPGTGIRRATTRCAVRQVSP